MNHSTPLLNAYNGGKSSIFSELSEPMVILFNLTSSLLALLPSNVKHLKAKEGCAVFVLTLRAIMLFIGRIPILRSVIKTLSTGIPIITINVFYIA